MTSTKKRLLAGFVVMLAAAFCSGFFIGKRAYLPRNNAAFHDLRFTHVRDFPALVEPKHKTIRALAAELKTPEAAYKFVQERIVFAPASPDASATEVLRNGAGSCLGKAALLCSLYRAMGFPPTAVRVITGSVAVSDYMTDHAWLDLEYRQTCFQQDPSGMLGVFDFAQFPGMEFSRSFVRSEDFCFNDKGFGIVSQLNLFRGSPVERMHQAGQ